MKAVAFTALDKVRAHLLARADRRGRPRRDRLADRDRTRPPWPSPIPTIGWPPAPMKPLVVEPAARRGAVDHRSTRIRSSRPTPSGSAPALRHVVHPTGPPPRRRARLRDALGSPAGRASHGGGDGRADQRDRRARERDDPARPGGDEPRGRRLQRRLPGAARRVRHAGERHRVPAAEALRRDRRRAARRLERVRRVARRRRSCRRTSSGFDRTSRRWCRTASSTPGAATGGAARRPAGPTRSTRRGAPSASRATDSPATSTAAAFRPRTSRKGCSRRAAPSASTST